MGQRGREGRGGRGKGRGGVEGAGVGCGRDHCMTSCLFPFFGFWEWGRGKAVSFPLFRKTVHFSTRREVVVASIWDLDLGGENQS